MNATISPAAGRLNPWLVVDVVLARGRVVFRVEVAAEERADPHPPVAKTAIARAVTAEPCRIEPMANSQQTVLRW
jgi:hypothetical protein